MAAFTRTQSQTFGGYDPSLLTPHQVYLQHLYIFQAAQQQSKLLNVGAHRTQMHLG
jgi:hypothetical protein